MNLSVAVADRPWQVNKIIGCLQVFQGILFLPSVARFARATSPHFVSGGTFSIP